MIHRATRLLCSCWARIAGGAVVCAAVLALSGCQGIGANTAESAQVRFVDTSVDAPALDMYVNGSGTAYNLTYGTFSSYVAVSSGNYQISAYRANTGQVLVNARSALNAEHQYTAVISNRLGRLQETIYPDVPPPFAAGAVSVRVLNAADAGPLDVYLTPHAGSLALASPLAADLGDTAASGYAHLPANVSYSIAAVPAGVAPSAASVVTVAGTRLTGPSGAVRTVLLSDAPRETGKSVNAFVLNDVDVE